MEASTSLVAGPTGYAPAATAALEKFSGVNFDDWNYKLKAACIPLGLSDILLHPDEWQVSFDALQRRVDSRISGLSGRSSAERLTRTYQLSKPNVTKPLC